MELLLCASLVKGQTSAAGMVIAPEELARGLNEGAAISPIAVAIDMSLIISATGQQMTIKEMTLGSGTTEESLAKYRITKEEFYSLD